MRKIISKTQKNSKNSEKGAALVTVLLVTFLLLAMMAGLLLVVSSHSSNVTDSAAERLAYNAAESGIQTTINVLRGNTIPSPLLDNTKPASHVNNKIDFTKALKVSTSNIPGETSMNPRLSRWMTYNYTPPSASNPDRISIGSGTYDPVTGNAFNVTISDPDNPLKKLSANTTAKIGTSGGSSKIYGSSPNTVTITYNPITLTDVDVSGVNAAVNLGSFTISVNGTGAAVTETRFEIKYTTTFPFSAVRILRGTILPGNVTSTSVGNVRFEFDSDGYDLMGSRITLANNPFIPNPPSVNSGQKDIAATVSSPEPIRLLIRSVGFGPRGSRKLLEAVVRKTFFDGLSAPAALTLIGSTSGFVFNPGNSNNVSYSGNDISGITNLPSIGVTNTTNLGDVNGSGIRTPPDPPPADVSDELPQWLQSTYNLDETIQNLKSLAQASGRYYPSGVTPPNFGNNATAQGITFADGDVQLSGNGGGILICTGTLTLHGDVDFNGLIIVTGPGGMERSGGGGGLMQGNTVVAPYDPNNLGAGFLSPKYDISGGGNSTMAYNSSSQANGLTSVSTFVLGVAEK